jgi:hypothetical protein
VFNPGALPLPSGGVLLLAKAQSCHWWSAVGIRAEQYLKGDPAMIVLNDKLKIESTQIVEMVRSFPVTAGVEYEDFRLFRYQGEVWANHGMISIRRKHRSSSTYDAATPCISRLDTDKGALSFLGHPQVDFETEKVEKNWLFFEKGRDLYLLYSISPYRLLKLKDLETLSFETVLHEDLGDQLKDVGGFGTMISFSTNPIEYDDDYLLILIHQVERKGAERFYHHWAVLVDKATLRPARITWKPIFSGFGVRGKKPGIIFVTSVVRRQDNFIFLMGEGDAYITYASLDRDQIEPLFRGIGSAQN